MKRFNFSVFPSKKTSPPEIFAILFIDNNAGDFSFVTNKIGIPQPLEKKARSSAVIPLPSSFPSVQITTALLSSPFFERSSIESYIELYKRVFFPSCLNAESFAFKSSLLSVKADSKSD